MVSPVNSTTLQSPIEDRSAYPAKFAATIQAKGGLSDKGADATFGTQGEALAYIEKLFASNPSSCVTSIYQYVDPKTSKEIFGVLVQPVGLFGGWTEKHAIRAMLQRAERNLPTGAENVTGRDIISRAYLHRR